MKPTNTDLRLWQLMLLGIVSRCLVIASNTGNVFFMVVSLAITAMMWGIAITIRLNE